MKITIADTLCTDPFLQQVVAIGSTLQHLVRLVIHTVAIYFLNEAIKEHRSKHSDMDLEKIVTVFRFNLKSYKNNDPEATPKKVRRTILEQCRSSSQESHFITLNKEEKEYLRYFISKDQYKNKRREDVNYLIINAFRFIPIAGTVYSNYVLHTGRPVDFIKKIEETGHRLAKKSDYVIESLTWKFMSITLAY